MAIDKPDKPYDGGCHINGFFAIFSKRRVFIETYGCRYNFGDTAKLVEILKHEGAVIVESPDIADAAVINTCTVVGPTERRMLRRIVQLREIDLFVTGCMAAVQRDAIFAVASPKIIPPELIHEEYQRVGTVAGDGIGIVQIAQGCTGKCSYCITRLARGTLKSFPREELLAQVKKFIHVGAPEIQITAQDVSAWGLDKGTSLPDLLTSMGDLTGRYMLRVGMMNPTTVKENLDDLVAAFSSEHIYKFVHIPVQSGADSVLARMRRGYSVADFEEIIAAFRKKFPSMTIATDMIVGFCGETPEDFSASLDLVRRVKPNKVNVTRYSWRPFTSQSLEKELPDHVKKERSRILDVTAREIYASLNGEFLGTIVPFIVTEKLRNGSVMARSPDYRGMVINENLHPGFSGHAVLKEDHLFFFAAERVQENSNPILTGSNQKLRPESGH